MKANLMTITPEWAQKILNEKNAGNRPMNRIHVESLAKEMKRGAWKVNGDTICMNEDRLIDGQHRLAAIALSGVSIQTFVVEGLASDVFDTKDVGKRRSAGDTLGVRGEQNACRLAACLVLTDKYMTGRADKSVSYTNTEMEELLEKYHEARESLQTSYKAKGLILPSVLDACHYLFSKKDPVMTAVFMEKLFKGIGLEEGDPWYALRERLVMNSLSNAKLSKGLLMALCIKAWNAARHGKRISKLQLNTVQGKLENFPVVL